MKFILLFYNNKNKTLFDYKTINSFNLKQSKNKINNNMKFKNILKILTTLTLMFVCSNSLFAQWTGVNNNFVVKGTLRVSDSISFTKGQRIGVVNYINTDTLKSLRMYGASTCYEDFRIDGVNVGSGASEPALTSGFAGSSALSQRVFQGSAQDDQVFFNIQMPHAWKEGGYFELHIHNATWTNPVATDTAVWELTYNWQNIDGTFTTPTTVKVKQSLGSTVQWRHNLKELVQFNSTGKTLSSVIVCRLRRLANSNASDTYTGGITVLYIDGHYEVDSFGSYEEYSK